MEKLKIWLDISIVVFGLLAAIAAIFGLIIGNRIDYRKKLEEKQWQAKISESSAQAEKAKEEAATALSTAATMNERANALELETEKQKERAAKAEKELLELQEKLKPRSIASRQVESILAELKKLPKGIVNISSPLGNSESSNYAFQFKQLLDKAGWEVKADGIGLSTITGGGVFIITPNQKDEYALILLNVFSQNGLNVHGELKPDFPSGEVNLFIGDKPQN